MRIKLSELSKEPYYELPLYIQKMIDTVFNRYNPGRNLSNGDIQSWIGVNYICINGVWKGMWSE